MSTVVTVLGNEQGTVEPTRVPLEVLLTIDYQGGRTESVGVLQAMRRCTLQRIKTFLKAHR